VNGHRVNDNVYGQAEIGAEFGLDPAIFERVEIIRGPASALYGDSAFFAVVNVITRTGASLNGASIAVEGGSLDTARAHASLGRALGNGLEFALSGTYERSGGVERLYFPAFDTPETNNGVADGLDGEQLRQFYSRITFKDLTFTGAYGQRQRLIPTASFGSLFNEHRTRAETIDRHTLLDAEYERSIGATRLVARASYDRYSADGIYPFAGLENDDAPLIGRILVLGTRWSVGTWLTRPLPGRQVLTFGAEFIDNVHQDQRLNYSNPDVPGFIENGSSTQHAFFVQDEFKVARWLILNAGARYDGYEEFRRLTPRAAVIVMPSPTQFLQVPFWIGVSRAERVRAEQLLLRGAESAARVDRDARARVGAIRERLAATVGLDVLVQSGRPDHARAGSFDVPGRHVRQRRTSACEGARARGTDANERRCAGGDELCAAGCERSRNPRGAYQLATHMLKARVSVAGPIDQSFISVEALHLSSRTTLAGHRLPSATLATVTMIQPVGRSFELSGTVRNLFNEQYADPASSNHVQDSISQNGRTVRIGLRWKLRSK
jgi:outer membrane receptor for ferrienterochelin and colicins